MNKIKTFSLDNLGSELKGHPVEYLEFLKEPNLSCGIYHLAAGESDPQQPHAEDEVYLVISGSATFKTEAGDTAVEAGSVLYVAAHAEHRFVDITEELTLLVFFAAIQN